jgi:hypothetical protein
MKTIKKYKSHIKIIIIFILVLLLKNCKENVRKEERLGPRGPISERLSYQLKNNKWKLRKYRIIDQSKGEIIYKKDIDNIILSFNEENILKNNKYYGKINYEANEFIINNIDTLTNRYYLLYLKDGQAILQNNVLFYKNNHIIKSLVIHISLSTDTTKGNEEYYNIEP